VICHPAASLPVLVMGQYTDTYTDIAIFKIPILTSVFKIPKYQKIIPKY